MPFVLIFLFFCGPGLVFAQNKPSLDDTLVEKNREISNKIDEWAKDLDVYLADNQYGDEPNRTSITLKNNFEWKEGGFSYRPHIGVKLHLPNLQKRLQLRFTSYDEDLEERGINRNRFRSEQLEENYGTSIAVFQKLGRVTTEFRPRVEIRDNLLTSYLLKFTSEAKVGLINLKPEIQLFARSDTGTGQFFAFNFDFDINSSNIIKMINEEQYTDGDNTFSTNNGFRFLHRYSDRVSQEYSLIFESHNRDAYHLERYVLDTTFGHQLYRNILHYGITPYIDFEKKHKFYRKFGMRFRLELIF